MPYIRIHDDLSLDEALVKLKAAAVRLSKALGG